MKYIGTFLFAVACIAMIVAITALFLNLVIYVATGGGS